MKHIVGLGEIKVSSNRNDILIAHSLGSCLGVTAYDPVICAGGMAHLMLPSSSIDKNKAREKPGMFVDSGLKALFDDIYSLGARKDRIILKVAGGSRIIDKNGFFEIGLKNYSVLSRILSAEKFYIAGKDIGGIKPRKMIIEINTGLVVVKCDGKLIEL
ncbi:chemotaxis protein CheD [Candidatus Poribacteria bacterium]|nr:chemotaxis protein CheD [Candidatus Poribacteria bacterium]